MAPTRRDWQIVQYEPQMTNRVAKLHSTTKQAFDEDTRIWRYHRSPAASHGTFINLAMDDDQTIGEYGVSLHYYNYRGQKIVGAASQEALTHPGHRRRGIFKTLAKDLYARLRAAGIPFIIGFPNATSQPGVLGPLNWVRLRPNFQLVAPISSVRWHTELLSPTISDWLGAGVRGARIASSQLLNLSKHSFLHGYKVAEVGEPSEETDALWKTVKDSAILSTYRDRHYLDWRYCMCPNREYRLFEVRQGSDLKGFAAITRPQQMNDRNTSHIMELLVEPGNSKALITLLTSLQEAQLEEHAGFSQILCTASRWEIPYLFASGFIRVPDSFSKYIAIEAALHLQNEPRPNELYDSKSWLAGFGDTGYV